MARPREIKTGGEIVQRCTLILTRRKHAKRRVPIVLSEQPSDVSLLSRPNATTPSLMR
jgi:hypothetical protein